MKKERSKPGPKAAGGKKKPVMICLTDDTKRMLQELATAQGISASTWVARAVLMAMMRAK